MEAKVVLITCGSEENARQIAEALIAEKLAACVNIIPGLTSVYAWEGKVCRETEWLLIVKTTGQRIAALEKRTQELHSYSTPEFVVLEPEYLSPKYGEWLKSALP